MSEKSKIPWEMAMPVAEEMVDILKPFCMKTPAEMFEAWPHSHLIVVAGSLRRLSKYVSDAEIVFVPLFEPRHVDMFTTIPLDLAGEKIDSMLKSGLLAKRPNVRGTFAWGEKNKLAIHVPSGLPVDLFSTTAENFFVSLVIRTGSRETNLALTMGAQKQNASLMAYGCGVKWSDGTVTAATSEQHVFEMCKVEYKLPKDR